MKTKTDNSEKTIKQEGFGKKIWNVITWPFVKIFGLFCLCLLKAPQLLLIAILLILFKYSKSPHFSQHQAAKAEQICKLAGDYRYGSNGMEQNEQKALKYYTKAAKKGNVEAIYQVGLYAKLGELCLQDLDAASYHFFLAAQSDHKPAFRELETLAEDGVVSAQNRCGLCYEFGYSTPVAMESAVRWYRQAAEQGNPHGQYNLGLCYYHGRGVEKNNSEALKWCKLAAKQGHKEAKQMVKEIKK